MDTNNAGDTLYRAACLHNENGDIQGYVTHPTGMTEDQWQFMADTLECAWGVYFNDDQGEYEEPDEAERESTGCWGARTPESVAAFRAGVMPFFAHIIEGESHERTAPVGYGPICNIHWI